jgi:hypothetical protein
LKRTLVTATISFQIFTAFRNSSVFMVMYYSLSENGSTRVFGFCEDKSAITEKPEASNRVVKIFHGVCLLFLLLFLFVRSFVRDTQTIPETFKLCKEKIGRSIFEAVITNRIFYFSLASLFCFW